MTLGAPTLRVRRLEPMLDFYAGHLGLSPRVREDGASSLRTVELGFADAPGQTLLTLRGARSFPGSPDEPSGIVHITDQSIMFEKGG